MLNLREGSDPCPGSRRGSGRRGSPCARWPRGRWPRRRSAGCAGRARCASPGCTRGCRRRRPSRRAACRLSIPSSACSISVLACGRCRPGPASCPAARAGSRTGLSASDAARSNGASAPRAAASTCSSSTRPRGRCSLANLAAYSPARLPNTSRSDSELPPRRLAPCMPAGAFAGGEQPRHRRHLRVAVDPDAAHDVVGGRARPPSAPW